MSESSHHVGFNMKRVNLPYDVPSSIISISQKMFYDFIKTGSLFNKVNVVYIYNKIMDALNKCRYNVENLSFQCMRFIYIERTCYTLKWFKSGVMWMKAVENLTSIA